MRVLICGSRGWTDRAAIGARVNQLHRDHDIVIHGGAHGADHLAGQEAQRRGIHTAEVLALWHAHGKKSAGHVRNHVMVKMLEPDLVIAFSLGSLGTQGTINLARRFDIPVEVHGYEANSTHKGRQK